jgi:hypothetical protein
MSGVERHDAVRPAIDCGFKHHFVRNIATLCDLTLPAGDGAAWYSGTFSPSAAAFEQQESPP